VTTDATFDDDVEGRARVRDNDELLAFYDELAEHGAGALWTVANAIEPWEPVAHSVPFMWSYEKLRPMVLRSTELVRPEDAGRRVVMLLNPRRHDVAASVGWLYSGIQIMLAGERASAHRHGASALRWILEGEGAYTIVDGEKARLAANDFVITPHGTWHEHGSEGTSGPVIWQDGLDIPLVNALEANWYQVHPDLHQALVGVVDRSPAEFMSAGVLPVDARTWNRPYSPLLRYPWERSYEALLALSRSNAGSEFDGHVLRYCNPVNGADVMATMGAQLQRLDGGQATKAHRHTGNSMVTVAKGRGHSIIGGQRFDWRKDDVFCIPAWAWHEHVNDDPSNDAVLFSFDDRPVISALSLYREQAHPEGSQLA
jgi:gentisate 1,2-dioxygenase